MKQMTFNLIKFVLLILGLIGPLLFVMEKIRNGSIEYLVLGTMITGFFIFIIRGFARMSANYAGLHRSMNGYPDNEVGTRNIPFNF